LFVQKAARPYAANAWTGGLKMHDINTDLSRLISEMKIKELLHLTYKDEINSFFIKLIDQKTIPWQVPWCRPEPVNYATGEGFRGVNFILLRSQNPVDCPFWLSRSYIQANDLKINKFERKGTPVIVRQDNQPEIEMFFNLRQLEDFKAPALDDPVKPPIEQGLEKIAVFFAGIKPYDRFPFDIKDFHYEEDYYYRVFQYHCYNWLCDRYNVKVPFRPDLYNLKTLTFSIGAYFLAAYCRTSTAYIGISGLERNSWRMLLSTDKNAIFKATGAAWRMYEEFLAVISLKKAS